MKKIVVITFLISTTINSIDNELRSRAYGFGYSQCSTDCESCCTQAYPDNPEAQAACRLGCKDINYKRSLPPRIIDEREG